MRDGVGAAVAVLLFLFGIIAWNQFTNSIPVTVPPEVTAMAVIAVAIVSLLAYSQINPHR